MGVTLRKYAPRPSEIGGQVSPQPDKNARRELRPITFRELARFAWPEKTEYFLAHLTECDPRTCRRWLAGTNGPPAEALGVIMQEILRRLFVG